MHVQIMLWEGPRSAAAVEASARAGRERIAPLIDAHPELRERLLGGFRAVGSDGVELVVELARDEAALDELGRLVMTSELVPGEDPALLRGPDRIQRYSSSDAFGRLADLLAEVAR